MNSELAEYMQAIEQHQDHPVVKKWFHQITPCQIRVPGHEAVTFVMIEFRDGGVGAMVWNDGNGNWGTGGWRLLSTNGLLAIDIAYMQGAQAAATFAEVLDMVATRRSEVVDQSPKRPWWNFWS